MTEHGKDIVDLVAAGGGAYSGASWVGIIASNWLTPIASLFTIIWLGTRILESKSCQRLIKRIKDMLKSIEARLRKK
jgi:hypothetical protein